ncbi:hypothetical protein [Streptomyces sp. NPDC059349]
MNADRAHVEPGDILLLHTGYARHLAEHDSPPPEAVHAGAVLDSADPRLHTWIRESGVAAIAADNHAVEAFPALTACPGQPVLPLHYALNLRCTVQSTQAVLPAMKEAGFGRIVNMSSRAAASTGNAVLALVAISLAGARSPRGNECSGGGMPYPGRCCGLTEPVKFG